MTKNSEYGYGSIICPYCGYKEDHWHEWMDNPLEETQTKCMDCGKEYLIEGELTVDWFSQTPENDLESSERMLDTCIKNNYDSQILYHQRKVDNLKEMIKRNNKNNDLGE